MPLQATSGAASYDAFGGGVAAVPNYIEDVFSTYLYTGTGASQTITNGIDLSTKGGLVWIKSRSAATNNNLFDTAQGATKLLHSNTTDATVTDANSLTAFNTTGFTLGSGNTAGNQVNTSAATYASWTFRKQPKFFDVVTYTGNGTNRRISHSLGSTPGFIIVKCTSTARNWYAWHRSLTPTTEAYMILNGTSSVTTGDTDFWGTSAPTSTDFGVGGAYSGVNANGDTYVAYLYAHDAGGFGLTGTDNVISCGTFTGNSAGDPVAVNLGYEAQWVMHKRTNGTGNWAIFDSMRGAPTDQPSQDLLANSSAAEVAGYKGGYPTSTGFVAYPEGTGSPNTYIYIAIRRGPMKVPTSGTSVFSRALQNGSGTVTTGFPADLVLASYTTLTNSYNLEDRLRGAFQQLVTTTLAPEQNDTPQGYNLNLSNVSFLDNYNNASYPVVYESFRRAPSFFDIVCYTGSGSNTTKTHNLTVVPELILVKSRSDYADWAVYSSALQNTEYLVVNSTAAKATGATRWNSTTPTSTVFSIGTHATVNASASTYVAYLFATCAGVSKVGSYTGTGALQTVNCGFTSGVRFVFIKRTDSTGDWYVYDSARGISSGNDPYLLFNSTAAQVTGTNYVDTDSTGFKVTAAAPAGLNASGGTYIFLAIA